MKLDWIRENSCRWDADKARIVGAQPKGIFADFEGLKSGEPLPGEWWRVAHEGRTLGYAWMDRTWDGAEILLAVDPSQQGQGVGTFIVDQLEKEAFFRGLNQLYNVVADSHPNREGVTKWLLAHGFKATDDGELRRPVKKQKSQ